MNEKVLFSNLVQKVTEKKLLLPDFQRKFVWDKDMMCKLYASVLCRMPLGSILVLNSSDDEFSCKEIGALKSTEEFRESIVKGAITSYLIDGQQRLTSLFAGFTTYFLEAFYNKPKEIASDGLMYLYFLKIPSKVNEDDEIDIFNIKKLSFEETKYESSDYFPSSVMQKIISYEKASTILKDFKENYIDVTNPQHLNALEKYCTEEDDEHFFHIPLQFLFSNNDDIQISKGVIIDSIVSHFRPKEISSERLERTKGLWKDRVIAYLNFCLTNIDLNQITVENSDKARAIDIYSNLNLGGVSLSVFDLIMAKVGSVAKYNFYDKLTEYIEAEKNYPIDLVAKEDVKNILKNKKINCSCTIAKVIGNKGITKEYINVFLNVLVMYVTQHNRKNKEVFDVNCTKQEKILELTANEIKDNAELVCDAIDRALFFFQTRCGIREISDINYKAQLTVVAYFFTDEKLFMNPNVHLFFEYWYWISIFSYMYQSNQNIQIYSEIIKFEKYFENPKKNHEILDRLQKFRGRLLDVDGYSDEATLTYDKDNAKGTPPAVMSKYICQYYMAYGYNDFFDKNIRIDFFYPEDLEMHHIMPLGSDPDFKHDKITFGASTKELRKDKENPYNSPLNMLYITKSANRQISDLDYSSYSAAIKESNVLQRVDCKTILRDGTTIKDFLSDRYSNFKATLGNRVDDLYNCLEK